jgi:hypothetical protein
VSGVTARKASCQTTTPSGKKDSSLELHLYNVSPELDSEIHKLIDKGI